MATEAVNIICRNNSCGSTHFSKVKWCPYCGASQLQKPVEVSGVVAAVEEVFSESEELQPADTSDLLTEHSVPPPVRKVESPPVVNPFTEPQNQSGTKFNFQRLAVAVVLAAIVIWGAGSLWLTGVDGENAEQVMDGLDQQVPKAGPISTDGAVASQAGSVSKPNLSSPAQNLLTKPEIKTRPEQQQPISDTANKFEIDKKIDSNEISSPQKTEEPRKSKTQAVQVEKLLVDAELWITQENAQSQANAISNANEVLSSKHDGVRTLQQMRRAEFIKEQWKAIRKSVSDDTVQ